MGEGEKKPLCLACHQASGLIAGKTTAQRLYLLGVGQGVCLATGCDDDLAEFAGRTRAIAEMLCADCRGALGDIGIMFAAATDAAQTAADRPTSTAAGRSN